MTARTTTIALQRQATFVGRLSAGSRRLSERLESMAFRGQLGPTRESERRDFSPGRRI